MATANEVGDGDALSSSSMAAEDGDGGKRRAARGTIVDPSLLGGDDGDGGGKRRARGTVIDQSLLRSSGRVSAHSEGYVDESGKPISREAKVADSVKFPARHSLMRRICLEEDEIETSATPAPSSNSEPMKTSLKKFNRGSIAVDQRELNKSNSMEYDQGKTAQSIFLMKYGLTSVMIDRVQSTISNTYHLTVILDNGPLMKREDAKYITGESKDACWLKLPDDNRLGQNPNYNLTVATCQRFNALQDLLYFFTFLAATMALPTTFEIVTKTRKIGGIGRGFRRVGLPQGTKQVSAEHYIPIGEQVESALELIEDLEGCISSITTSGYLPLIHDVKKYYEEELLEIEKEEKNILVVIMASIYPWGRGDNNMNVDSDKENFVKLLNEFADLPVTFVFLLETRDNEVVNFYDNLISSESGIKADVRVAKGLGLMIDGIAKYNPWLNFCLPMHLCQALGVCSNTLSQAASRPLLPDEVKELCATLIGDIPDPNPDKMDEFYNAIETLMADKHHVKWNPITGDEAPFIDTVKLKKHFSKMPISVGMLVAICVCIVAIIIGHFVLVKSN